MNRPEPPASWRAVMNGDDWQAGFDAGEAGWPLNPVPAGRDDWSWISGWIEGDAKRKGYSHSRGVRA